MQRISEANVKALAVRLNQVCGHPEQPYAKVDGKHVPQAHCYHIDFAYGGVTLMQMMPTGSGCRNVFNCGFIPKRELWELMRAMLVGIETAKENTENALQVIAKDPKISAWLQANDPKALEQVQNALK
jgi:hypothetical protein